MSELPRQFDPSIVSEIVCPACHGDLRFENSTLICAACGCAYPVVDGIPVLIVDRAKPASGSPAGG